MSTSFTAQKDDHSSSVQIDGITEWTSWITLPETDRTQIYINVIALNGIYKDAGGGKIDNSVTVEFEIEELDDALCRPETSRQLRKRYPVPRQTPGATTIETVTIFTGPCRVRARRSSQYDYVFRCRG